MNAIPLVDLPGTEWRVWSAGVLRSAGFPAAGLDRLGASECAELTDAYLDDVMAGTANAAAFSIVFKDAVFKDVVFKTAFAKAHAALYHELVEIAGDDLFIEAVAWQNPTALVALDKLVAAGPDAPDNCKRREREKLVARYWSRYCGKNDTIGFFGPVCWFRIADAFTPAEATSNTADAFTPAEATSNTADAFTPAEATPNTDGATGTVTSLAVTPGPALVRDRVVDFEWWALAAFADRYRADEQVRAWLPLSRHPHHSTRDGALHRPGQAPIRLSKAEEALLRAADGRPAAVIAAELGGQTTVGFRKADDVLVLADALGRKDLLLWRLELPYDIGAESALAGWIAGLPDETVRDRVTAEFRRLVRARDRVADCAADPVALRAALSVLDAEFEAITGLPPRQRLGETYAGRALCYPECSRDVEVTLGTPVLATIAEPLAILLRAARWLTAAIAAECSAELRELYDELAGSAGAGGPVPLGDLWYLALGLLYGEGDRPVNRVMTEFVRRWEGVLGLADQPPETRQVRLSSAQVRSRADRVFAADAPGWSTARIHSPDLLLLGESVAAIERGEFTAVLGELHAAWLTCLSGVFTRFHPDPDALTAAVARDVGARVIPLHPTDFPQHTARLNEITLGPSDIRLGYVPAPHADRDRNVPVTDLQVSIVDDTLVATAPDGRCWPVIELFAGLLSTFAVNAYKIVGKAAHTPRVTIDRLVVVRETWSTTIGASRLVEASDHRRRYLAARALRRELGLPERVFVKIGTEVKPLFLDLTSPVSVGAVCTMLHSARRTGGDDVPLTFTELLPTPDQAWLPDAEGRRYHCELRLHVVDPIAAPTMQRASG